METVYQSQRAPVWPPIFAIGQVAFIHRYCRVAARGVSK